MNMLNVGVIQAHVSSIHRPHTPNTWSTTLHCAFDLEQKQCIDMSLHTREEFLSCRAHIVQVPLQKYAAHQAFVLLYLESKSSQRLHGEHSNHVFVPVQSFAVRFHEPMHKWLHELQFVQNERFDNLYIQNT